MSAGLSDEQKNQPGRSEELRKPRYPHHWSAPEGTIDPGKVREGGEQRAVIGNPQEVATQLKLRYHPEDRIMCWFDFFNHDSEREKGHARHGGVYVEGGPDCQSGKVIGNGSKNNGPSSETIG